MNRIAVMGAGVMGAQIAALFAAAGFQVDLLDVSDELAQAGKDRLRQLKPSPLYAAADLAAIRTGSLERPLPQADWYLEAIIEDLEAKRALMARVEAEGSPQALVSTNTSSLSVAAIAEGRAEDLRRRFFGCHFFNPPRYLPLVELIGAADAAAAVLTHRLGKRCVRAHDTPGFIANRIGGAAITAVLQAVAEQGLGLDAADAITGTPLGRSRSATFRTLDLVGLDTLQRVAGAEQLPAWIGEMVRRGWVGEKAGQGFYKREHGEILVIDPQTLEYRPRRRLRVDQPIQDLVYADTREGRFAWAALAPLLLAAAAAVPEAADDPAAVDAAMRWGYSWRLGPFAAWDRIGFRKAAERLKAEGHALPPLAQSLWDEGASGFYADGRVWSPGAWVTLARDPREIDLADMPAVWQTPAADLRDLGDGIACLHLHPDHDAIGPEAVTALRRAAAEVGGSPRWQGLVLAGASAERFSVGANLALLVFAAEEEDWDQIDQQLRAFQEAALALRHLDRPVVAALSGMALGGGCELCLASDRAQAAAESYIGLVELGAGLIPAGGGCKEMVRRSRGSPRRIAAALQTIGQARVSESARQARELGFLGPGDGISLDAAHLLADARDAAALLWAQGYQPPRAEETFPVLGRDGEAALELAVYEMRSAGRISDYDRELGNALAHVLAGGDLPAGTAVKADYMLELEREAFIRLLHNAPTQARMAALLRTGRPLRN